MRLTYKLVIIGLMIAALMRTRLTETIENPQKVKLSDLVNDYPESLRQSIYVWKLVPRTAFVLFVVGIFVSFTSALFQPILALYMVGDLGLTELQLSYVWTIFPISMIALALPAGKLIDKVGKKKPILASFVLWAVAILLVVDGNYLRVLLAMISVGALNVLVNSSSGALSAGLVPKEHRGKVNGSKGFFRLIAASLGQLSGGWLFDNVSHQAPFLIQIALVAIPFILVYIYVDDNEELLH
jgi:MFS family permease